jgi:beta-glucanase (GH16 family)
MILPIILAAAAQASFTVANASYDVPMHPPANAKPIWKDEFSGRSLDLDKWEYDTSRNKLGWYNGEKQYYSAGLRENIRVENGRLIIDARHEKLDPTKFSDWGGQQYTSAKIYSKTGWTYGFYEVRAKLPCARGTWPAVWMLPVHMKAWPDDGEIDIMEHVGSKPHEVVASLHTKLFNHILKTQRSAQKALPTSCSAFHRFQLDWQPSLITIGVDNRAYMRVRNDQPGGKAAWPFDVPFKMILNLAIGGKWAGAKGIDDAAMPQRMEVDYVRVWKRPAKPQLRQPNDWR